jgi:hypothetical protein
MALKSNTINPNPIRLQKLHNILLRSRRLRTRIFNIIVIVIQFRPRVCSSCGAEGDFDVIGPEDLQEGVVLIGPVFVEGFV